MMARWDVKVTLGGKTYAYIADSDPHKKGPEGTVVVINEMAIPLSSPPEISDASGDIRWRDANEEMIVSVSWRADDRQKESQ